MRPRFGLFVVCALLLSLVVTASASAQGSVLQASSQVVTPGDPLTVTGNSFSNLAGYSPVRIRLNSRTGPVLATANPPDSLSNISVAFTVPNLAPGWYLLVATQTVDANGRHKSFTPGRTRIRVQAAARAAAGGGGGGGGWPGSPLAIVALLTLAGATTLAVRRLRTSNRPQLGS